MFTLAQGEDKLLGFIDAKYIEDTHIKTMNGYGTAKMVINKDQLLALMNSGKMSTGTWYNLKYVISGGRLTIYANSDKVGESDIAPDFSKSNAPVRMSIGGFKGYIDEIRIRNVNN